MEKFITKSFNMNYDNYNYLLSLDALIEKPNDLIIIPLSTHVTKFYLIKFFNNFVFPVLKVEMYVNPKLYYELVENLNNMKFRVNLDKTKVLDEKNSINTLVLPENYIKDKIFHNIDFDRYVTNKPELMKEEGFSHENNIKIELELIYEKHLKINRTPIVGIYNNTNMSVMMNELYSGFGINDLLIHEPNNKEIYDQIICPSKNLPKTIEYFQTAYGVYNTGMRLFFDLDDSYCIPNDLILNDLRKKVDSEEYGNVFILVKDVDNMSLDIVGSYVDRDNHRYLTTAQNVSIMETDNIGSREKLGEDLEIFMIGSNKNELTKISNLEFKPTVLNSDNLNEEYLKGNPKLKKYFSKYENEFALNSFIYEKTRDNLKLVLRMDSTDISFMTMNKRFYIYFKNQDLDQKYRGSYQLDNMITTFEKNGKEEFESSTLAVFNRLSKDILSLS